MKEKYLERELLDEIKKWIKRKEIIAIKGPRQSGKTTLLWMIRDFLINEKKIDQSRIIFLTLEDREILEKFILDPKSFIKSFIMNEKRHYFLLDEFHYLENGGKKLKFLYDTLENTKFIITGSSSLEIVALSKYLVGRVFSFYLLPFNFYEFLRAKDERLARVYKEKRDLARKFLLEGKGFKITKDIFVDDLMKLFYEYVTFGGYPEVIKTSNIETKRIVIKNIYDTYVGRDIIELLKISDVMKFRKLVSILATQIGNMVNYNELSSSCNSYYKEIVEFLNVLEETYILRLVRPFYRNLRTELRKNPKIYFLDIGLRNYMINNFGSLNERVDKGTIIENFVFNSLFDIVKDFGKINYWRTLSKAEVDFILTLGNELVPIEVKFTEIKKPKVSRSYRSFIKSYKPRRGIVLTKNLWGEMKVNNTTVKFIPACYL